MAKEYAYKYSEDKKAVFVNAQGQPIIIVKDTDEGSEEEIGVNAIENYQKIPELRTEAKQHRLAAKDAADGLKILTDNGVELEKLGEWVKASNKARETVENMKSGDLIKAGEVEKIKQQATIDLETKIDELTRKHQTELLELQGGNEEKEKAIRKLMIDDQFNKSSYVRDKLNMTPAMARAYFQNNFEVRVNENGVRIIAGKYINGDEILDSANNFGLADFDSCLERLVAKDPDKDMLIKGKGGGSGAGGPGKGGSGEINPWKRETFNLTMQGEIVKKDPALATRLSAEAGIGRTGV